MCFLFTGDELAVLFLVLVLLVYNIILGLPILGELVELVFVIKLEERLFLDEAVVEIKLLFWILDEFLEECAV